MQNLQHGIEPNIGHSKIIYFLYLASTVFGITALIGLIMAYMNIEDADTWLKTHYRYQIRTFWIGIVYSAIAFILIFVIIGYFLFLLIVVWMIIRCIKGMKALDKQEAIEDVTRWGF